MESNALSGPDNIVLPAGNYGLAVGSTGEDAAAGGDLDILDDLTITGADTASTVISGYSAFRLFAVLPRGDRSLPEVALSQLTLTAGAENTLGAAVHSQGQLTLDRVHVDAASSTDSAVYCDDAGLRIESSELSDNFRAVESHSCVLEVADSSFHDNRAETVTVTTTYDYGGAIRAAYGRVDIRDSSFNDNTATDRGGALFIQAAASLARVDFDNNISQAGGALFAQAGALTVIDSHFTNNRAQTPQFGYARAGAVYLDRNTDVLISGSQFSNNASDDAGGAVFAGSHEALRIEDALFSGNSASAGGGLWLSPTSGGETLITRSIIRANTASGMGGGLYADGEIHIQRSEISHNNADSGGGFTAAKTVSLRNVTLSNNTATQHGGGFLLNGDTTTQSADLINVTLAQNAASSGGNITNLRGIVRLSNAIAANAAGGGDCSGTITSLGYNLDSDGSCGLGVAGDISSTDPLLQALADNGGEGGRTHALATGSPARDAGLSGNCDDVDQRLYYRTDAACDMGAVEQDAQRATSGTLAFSSSGFSVDESAGSVSITVERRDGSQGQVSARLFDTHSGSASIYDYSLPDTPELSWLDGETGAKSIDIPIKDDWNQEGTENVVLGLEAPLGGAALDAQTAELQILDDDVQYGVLQLQQPSYSVAEDAATLSINVTRTDGSFGAVSVDYATADSSATAGEDYVAATGSLHFAAGETERQIEVAISDDALNEGEELFQLTLSNPRDGATLGLLNSAMISIVDDAADEPNGMLSLADSSAEIDEDAGTLRLLVQRTQGTRGEISVEYSVDGVTASSDDVAVTRGTLVMADGVVSKEIELGIVDDSLDEENETFEITLYNPQGGALLGANTTSVVTIIDNDTRDPGVLSFTTSSYAVSETAGQLSLTISRVGTDGEVSVDYATQDGSATAGEDYQSAAGTLTLLDGMDSATILLTLVDDAAVEDDETFTVSIHSPRGGASLGSQQTVTVSIENDDDSPSDGGTDGSTVDVASGGGGAEYFALFLMAACILRRKLALAA